MLGTGLRQHVDIFFFTFQVNFGKEPTLGVKTTTCLRCAHALLNVCTCFAESVHMFDWRCAHALLKCTYALLKVCACTIGSVYMLNRGVHNVMLN